MTDGRLKRVRPYFDERFCMTYGEGLADINIRSQIDFHMKHNRDAIKRVFGLTGLNYELEKASSGENITL